MNVTVHVAVPATAPAARVHGLPVKVPAAPVLEKVTDPVGVVGLALVSVTVTVQVEPWLTTTGLVHETAVVVVCETAPGLMVRAMTVEWLAGPLTPVKLRWKFPVGAEADAEIEHEVEFVAWPLKIKLLEMQVTVTEPAGAKDVELVLSVTVPTKWFKPVRVIVVLLAAPPCVMLTIVGLAAIAKSVTCTTMVALNPLPPVTAVTVMVVLVTAAVLAMVVVSKACLVMPAVNATVVELNRNVYPTTPVATRALSVALPVNPNWLVSVITSWKLTDVVVPLTTLTDVGLVAIVIPQILTVKFRTAPR